MSNNGIVNTGTSIAAFAVERVAGRAAGIVVQPVVWIATGASPDAADVALYSVGSIATIVGSTVVGVAAAGVGIIKGLVDDDTAEKLSEAKLNEPAQYRPFIQACVSYSGWAGQSINAMTIASKGGTAWMHPNGLWVYITDARGRLIADYTPRRAIRINQPLFPLRSAGVGRVRWHRL